MSFSRTIGAILILLGASQVLSASAAQAAPMVTYSWTTTNEGYGQNVSAPSSATFEVPLSDVLNGVIPQSASQIYSFFILD
jgi:hypothetical protein